MVGETITALAHPSSLYIGSTHGVYVMPGQKIKGLQELKDKLLGTGKGTMREYSKILYQALKYIIPRFERTRTVKITQADS